MSSLESPFQTDHVRNKSCESELWNATFIFLHASRWISKFGESLIETWNAENALKFMLSSAANVLVWFKSISRKLRTLSNAVLVVHLKVRIVPASLAWNRPHSVALLLLAIHSQHNQANNWNIFLGKLFPLGEGLRNGGWFMVAYYKLDGWQPRSPFMSRSKAHLAGRESHHSLYTNNKPTLSLHSFVLIAV